MKNMNWFAVRGNDFTMVSKPVEKVIGDGRDWDIDLDFTNPNDLEVYTKALALAKCSRAEEGWTLIYDYAVKTGRINREYAA